MSMGAGCSGGGGRVRLNCLTCLVWRPSLMWSSSSVKEFMSSSQTKQQVARRILNFSLRWRSCEGFQNLISSRSNSARSAAPSGQMIISCEKGKILILGSRSNLMPKQWRLAQAKVRYSESMQLLISSVQKCPISLNSTATTFSASYSQRSRQISCDMCPTFFSLARSSPHESSPQARQESWSSAFRSISVISRSFSRFHWLQSSRRYSTVVSPMLTSEKKLTLSWQALISFMKIFSLLRRSSYMGSAGTARSTISEQTSLRWGCFWKTSCRQASCQRSSSTTSVRFSITKSVICFWKSRQSCGSRCAVSERCSRSLPRMVLALSISQGVSSQGSGMRCFFLSWTASQRVRVRLGASWTKGQKSRWPMRCRCGRWCGRSEVQRATMRELCLAMLLAMRNFCASPSLTFTTRLSEQLSMATLCSLQKVTGRPCCMWSISPKHLKTCAGERQLRSYPASSSEQLFLFSSMQRQKRNLCRSFSFSKCRQLSPCVTVKLVSRTFTARSTCDCHTRFSFSSASSFSGLRITDELSRQTVFRVGIFSLRMSFSRFSCFSSQVGSRTFSTLSMNPHSSVSLNRSRQSSSCCQFRSPSFSPFFSACIFSISSLNASFFFMRFLMSQIMSLTSQKVSSLSSSWCLFLAFSEALQRLTRARKSQVWAFSMAWQKAAQLRSILPFLTAFLLWLRMETRIITSSKVPISSDTTSSLQQVISIGISMQKRPSSVRKNCQSRVSRPPQNCNDFIAVSMFLRLGGWIADPSTSPGSAKIDFSCPSCSSLIRRMSLSSEERWISGVEQSGSFWQKGSSRSRKITPSQTRPVRPALWLQLALLAQTSSRFSMRLRTSKRTSLLRQKSITYFTPRTVIELSAMLVEMMILWRLPLGSCSLRVISLLRMVEWTWMTSNSRASRSPIMKRERESLSPSISASPGTKMRMEHFQLSLRCRCATWSTMRKTVSWSSLCALGYLSLKMMEPHRAFTVPSRRNLCSESRQKQLRLYLPGSVTLIAGQGCFARRNPNPYALYSWASLSESISTSSSSSSSSLRRCCRLAFC